jgi:hypothetical protein
VTKMTAYPETPKGRVVAMISWTSTSFLTKERDGLYYVWIVQKGRRLRWDQAMRSERQATAHMRKLAGLSLAKWSDGTIELRE